MKINRTGQMTLEYIMISIIVLLAFFAVGNYFKRGLQGRWKLGIDDLGDQYDPRTSNAYITHRMRSDTDTQIIAINAAGRTYTLRTDSVNTIETKQGSWAIGGY